MNRRLGAVGISFVIFTLAIVFRLGYWQVAKGDELARAAQRQYATSQNLVAPRGQILTSDGFPLVTNIPTYTLAVDPTKIDDDQVFLQKILPYIKTPDDSKPPDLKNKILSLISNKGARWVSLSKDLSQELADKIQNLSLSGVYLQPGSQRGYPEASIAASLLGIVASDKDGNPTGYFGLEGYYDRELSGRSGTLKEEKDAQGNPILTGKFEQRLTQRGEDLTLYLDRGAQFIAETELSEGLKRYGAESGTVTIMDPKTGGVLTMANQPTFTPNQYQDADQKLLKNPVVSSSFEPGSIFKPLIMAAAINENAVTPDTICDRCSGPFPTGGYTIHTWNDQYYKDENMTSIIQHSDNVGMTFVADRLGPQKELEYLKKFAIGQLTGIDLEGEDTLPLRPDKDWHDIDYATASFGQGIAITPIQMVRALSAIASGGKLVQPHVVASVSDVQGQTQIKPQVVRNVVSSEAAQAVTQMMVNAVENGEAKWAAPKGFKIAGKTGTAQIPVGGSYEEVQTNASFIGFAPADHPRFVMLVTLHNPTTSPWAAETAAPLWFTIAKDLFIYWGVSNFR